MAEVEEILRKYGARIEKELRTEKVSVEYKKFKEEALPSLTRFERLCRGIGNILKVKIKKSDEEKIKKQLEVAHLDITAKDVVSFSILILLVSCFFSIIFSFSLYLITKTFPLFLLFLLIFFSIFLFYYTLNTPARIAQSTRLKTSSQMVPCILYVVIYMKHTPNLERAIKFASDHLQAPLALDLKKVFWDVEVGKYPNIKESLDGYLEKWREYCIEFVEAFHLIESSLYEPEEARRIAILEKSLSVILDGVYEKMLKFTHDVKAPLSNVYMLGIILPTLAIAILPLATPLLGELLKWQHVFVIFNMLIPFFVFYLTSQILSKRPGGYGEAELLEQNPNYYIYTSKKPYFYAFLLSFPLFLISMIPLFWKKIAALGFQGDYKIFGISFFEFINGNPFGLGALLLGLFLPLSVCIFFYISYSMKTSLLIKTREETKQLEGEFASSLFQLGNRLGDGIPAEIAFGKVAVSTRGTRTENFFKIVNSNVQQGMSVEKAIFDKKRGAIISYPSFLIKTSMAIMIEAIKKGLDIAARALMSISEYTKNIHKINERLKDLLADIISDMKNNMAFLAPLLAGIIMGISTMMISVFVRLNELLIAGEIEEGTIVFGTTIGNILNMFNVKKMISPYFLQLIIGIYLIEIIFILTLTLVTIESGSDKLREKAEIAKNLGKSITLYFFVALFASIALSFLAKVAIAGIG